MKKQRYILPVLLVSTTFGLATACAFSFSSCAKQDAQIVSVALHNQNSPITINKKNTLLHQDFYCILSTIKTNEISISQILINGQELETKDFTYNKTNGTLFIDKKFVNGDIVINASSINKVYSLNLSSDSIRGISFSSDQVVKNKTLEIQIENFSGKNIFVEYVSIDNVKIPNQNFNFCVSTQTLTILGQCINGDITFSVKEKINTIDFSSNFSENELTISGGSTILEGAFQASGLDSKNWKVSFNEKDVTSECEFKIEGEQSENIKISNKGIVSWNYLLPEGKTYFKIIAYYQSKNNNEEYKVISPIIELSIAKEFVWKKGSDKIEGIYHLGGFDDQYWKLYLGGKDVTSDSQLLLKNAPEEITISKDGQISWTNTLPNQVYHFQVSCVYFYLGKENTFSGDVVLTINAYETLSGGSINLKGKTGENGSDYKYWNTFISKGFVLPNFTLTGDDIDNIFIDRYGLVFWTANILPKTYNFQVKCSFYFGEKTFELETEIITLEISNTLK